MSTIPAPDTDERKVFVNRVLGRSLDNVRWSPQEGQIDAVLNALVSLGVLTDGLDQEANANREDLA